MFRPGRRPPVPCLVLALGLGVLAARQAGAQSTTYTNFENQQIHPLALSADGSRLFAVNTPDNRLTIYSVTAAGLSIEAEVPVGLDPVSVRPRGANEVWVVNHLSDDISIVDLTTMNVRATLPVGDEPTDVVFAGTAGRAFVCVSQEDAVKIYDPNQLLQAPAVVPIFGSDPRALAVSSDGTRVYVAVFESGNRTSTLPQALVTAGGGPPAPSPPRLATLPPPPPVGLILFWNGTNWLDETGTRNWQTLVSIPYTLPDNDVAELDANAATPAPRYFGGVGTLNYNITVNPATGVVYVPNIDSFNLTRFESNLKGRFSQNRISVIDPGPGTVTPHHLNAHINYAVSPGPASEIALSLSQLNGGDWDAAGDNLYVAALGSGKLAVLDRNGAVTARVDVGEGPSAAVVDDANARVYVLNRFTNSVATVSTAGLARTDEVGLGFNPEPSVIRDGRKFLYDARISSAHGDLACSTCHAFGQFDALAWDLGDPQGALAPSAPGLPPHHPMKGPMTTQTLRGLSGTAPFHWRGDRADFTRFNPAFRSLNGRADTLSTPEMQRFTDFIMTVTYPPNPNQNLDRTYPNPPPPTGSPERGRIEFTVVPHDGPARCQVCHQSTPPNQASLVAPGTGPVLFPPPVTGQTQVFKATQLRNQYEKTGFTNAPGPQKQGYGYQHDGSTDNVVSFLSRPVFQFANAQQRTDVAAFMLAFDTGTAPAVGVQQTVDAANRNLAAVTTRINLLRARADLGEIDLVVKGRLAGLQRGWLYQGGLFVSDRINEPSLQESALRALAASNGGELTYTGVPPGNGMRIGLDRDGDGWRDRDELDAGTNPADAASFPGVATVIDPGNGAGAFQASLGHPAQNPAPPSGTSIAFTVSTPADVQVHVFDAQGRLTTTLMELSRQQGTVTVAWDGRTADGDAAPSGVYFYRLEAIGAAGSRIVRTERVVLVR